MLSKTHRQYFSCYKHPEKKVWFTLSITYRFVVIEGKVKGQRFGSTWFKQINTIENQNSLPYVRYGYAAKTVSPMVNPIDIAFLICKTRLS